MNIKEIASEAASKALESKPLAGAVAGGTIGLGLSDIQTVAQLIATVFGIVLSAVLIVRHTRGIIRDEREFKEKQNDL